MRLIKYLVAILILSACGHESSKIKLVDSSAFASDEFKEEVKLFTLKNSNGLKAQITNYGGRVVSLWVPDKNGGFKDVSIGYNTLEEYKNNDESFYGATIGRYGNRIANAQFQIYEDTFKLERNDGENTLHGGFKGFHQRIWKVLDVTDSKLELNYFSKDGEEGFPGNLDVKVVYQLTDNNELKIEYFAQTDKATHVCFLNHTYFNLAGEASGTINNHILMINADNYTPVDSVLIPTGEIVSVSNTPFDFRKPTAIGDGLDSDNEQLIRGHGYDHNWVLNKKENVKISLAAVLKEPESGRVMEVYTSEPAIQFYGGNFMNGKYMGKYGKTLDYREALCLETQHFPDSPNNPQFPTTLLKPEDNFYSISIYHFLVE